MRRVVAEFDALVPDHIGGLHARRQVDRRGARDRARRARSRVDQAPSMGTGPLEARCLRHTVSWSLVSTHHRNVAEVSRFADRLARSDGMSSPTGNEAHRRAGRPRRDGRVVVGDPTDEVLRAASALFGERGVGGTTMSRIAEASGLGPSSLYYYFRSRDEIVAALVARANVVPLDLVDRIAQDGGSIPSKLFRFVAGDVEALCALPFDINEVHRIAARDRERFAQYWKERARLERKLSAFIRAGIDTGDLRPVDAPLVAVTIMSNDEGVQNWFRLGTRRRPRDIARSVAELTVGGLLSDRTPLSEVVAEVSKLHRNRYV